MEGAVPKEIVRAEAVEQATLPGSRIWKLCRVCMRAHDRSNMTRDATSRIRKVEKQ